MSLPVNLEEMLQGRSVEWERLEFKEGWNPEPILHTLCAFANDFHNLDGGYLFIGIAEQDGKPIRPPVGLNPATLDSLQKQILEMGYKIQPSYHPVVEPCVVDDKHILVLRAPGGQNRPYKAPEAWSHTHTYKYYIRKGSSTVAARGHDETELMSLAANIPFDDRTNQTALPRDLSLSLIKTYLQEIGSVLGDQADRMDFELLCRRMLIVDGPKEYVLPRNVGLMFFHPEPERFFPQAQIDVVQFPDGPGGDTLIEKSFRGPLSQQIRNALSYISNSILQEYVIKRPDRAEADRFFNYPYAAIEELLVNAVYHKSYEAREPIEVRILPDEITITSYPGPDRSIRLSDFAAGKSVARRYRNRRIGEFLKELKLTEGRGTGIPKVLRAMEANGSPLPRFDTDDDRTYFTTFLPIHASALNFTPQVGDQVGDQVANEKTEIVLSFCSQPKDRTEILERLGLKAMRNLRQRYLLPLIESGLLAMTDPEHPTSPVQKYVTTPLGRASLRQLEESKP